MRRITIFNASRNIRIVRSLTIDSNHTPRTQATSSSLAVVDATISPWEEVKVPGGIYYWNKVTNETTHVGAPRPKHWVEVPDPAGTNATYWWCPETNETTPLGAARPSSKAQHIVPYATVQNSIDIQPRPGFIHNRQQPAQESLGRSMVSYFTIGIGLSMGIAFARVLFGG